MATLPLCARASGTSRASREEGSPQRHRGHREKNTKDVRPARMPIPSSFHPYSPPLAAGIHRTRRERRAIWGYAAYFCRILSRNFLLSAVTSQAFGQKHRSTTHQSFGTPALLSAGSSLSKSSLPVPNGLCVLVLCSLSEPSL